MKLGDEDVGELFKGIGEGIVDVGGQLKGTDDFGRSARRSANPDSGSWASLRFSLRGGKAGAELTNEVTAFGLREGPLSLKGVVEGSRTRENRN